MQPPEAAQPSNTESSTNADSTSVAPPLRAEVERSTELLQIAERVAAGMADNADVAQLLTELTAAEREVAALREALWDFQTAPDCWCDSRDASAPSHSPACAGARRALLKPKETR